MIIKRLRPIYRLGRRPIINVIKSNPSALIPARILNPVWMRDMDFLLWKTPKTQVPNHQCRLGIERSNQIFKTDCMWRFGGCVLKSASFHKTWSPHPEVCILPQGLKAASLSPHPSIRLEGCALKSAFLHRLEGRVQKSVMFHKPEGRVPFIRFSLIQSRVLSGIQSRVLSGIQDCVPP